MPAVALIAGAFLLLAGVYVLFHMRRLWLNAPTRLDDDNLHGASFAPFWRAYRRALPIFAIVFVPMLTLTLVLGTINGGPIDGIGLNIVFVLAVSSIALAASVVLANRPKKVVPPHLRDEPGLFRELRSQKS
jgi:hypothetical protein